MSDGLVQHICVEDRLLFFSGSFPDPLRLFILYVFNFLPPHAILFSLPQPSAWPISVRLLSCTILSVLASRYSSVALLPVALPLIPPPPSLLLQVVKTLYISLKRSLFGGMSRFVCVSLSLSLLRNSLPFCFSFLFFFAFVLTFSFNLWACPSPAWPHFKFAYHFTHLPFLGYIFLLFSGYYHNLHLQSLTITYSSGTTSPAHINERYLYSYPKYFATKNPSWSTRALFLLDKLNKIWNMFNLSKTTFWTTFRTRKCENLFFLKWEMFCYSQYTFPLWMVWAFKSKHNCKYLHCGSKCRGTPLFLIFFFVVFFNLVFI